MVKWGSGCINKILSISKVIFKEVTKLAKGDKYIGLKRYLENLGAPMVILSFKDIENIIKNTLPNSAYVHAETWWSNNYDHSQAKAWIYAGYETDYVTDTYKEEKITFVKR